MKLENRRNCWIFKAMSLPKIDWLSPDVRRRWEEQNVETLRKWATLSLTEKIKIAEEMEEIGRTFHGGKFPDLTDEHDERTAV
jgi:hypothetical protein